MYPFQKNVLDKIRLGETPIIGIGRNMGKSYVNSLINNYYAAMQERYTPKIKWQRLPGLKLQAYVDEIGPRGFERGLRETDMDPVQSWTEECRCGTRMSFNVWKFKTEKQITMFLIKWSN